MDWRFELAEFFKYILVSFVMYGVFAIVERIRPAQRGQSARSVLFNLKWAVVYSALAIVMGRLGLGLVVERLQGLVGGPWVKIPAPWWGLGVLLYFLAVDFFYYWFHRWQHQVPLLWAEHQFHHSETALNVTSTRRVHWLEEPLVVMFVGIPVGLLLRVEGVEMGLLGFGELLWLQFIHMNLRLELGPLNALVVGPQQHRLHHSYLPQHIDRNFAVFFPLWDIAFGTYCAPQPREFPGTGLDSGETYDRLNRAFWLPFAVWFGPRR